MERAESGVAKAGRKKTETNAGATSSGGKGAYTSAGVRGLCVRRTLSCRLILEGRAKSRNPAV